MCRQQNQEEAKMKAIRMTVMAAALLAVPVMTIAIPVDGTADTAYGSAIVTQQLGTAFGDSMIGFVDFSDGSELDAAYGIISNGVLYLVLAGNLESNFNHLEVFLQTGAGGQNTLTNINPNVDFNGLNRMG